MTSWDNKLKPCPFCGGVNTKICIKGVNQYKYGVLCMDCDARGGRGKTKNEAIKAWNRRENNDN